MPTQQLERTSVLRAVDKCDHAGCNSRAFVRAHFPLGSIDFCRRHFNAVEETVTARADSITDERDRCK